IWAHVYSPQKKSTYAKLAISRRSSICDVGRGSLAYEKMRAVLRTRMRSRRTDRYRGACPSAAMAKLPAATNSAAVARRLSRSRFSVTDSMSGGGHAHCQDLHFARPLGAEPGGRAAA